MTEIEGILSKRGLDETRFTGMLTGCFVIVVDVDPDVDPEVGVEARTTERGLLAGSEPTSNPIPAMRVQRAIAHHINSNFECRLRLA